MPDRPLTRPWSVGLALVGGLLTWTAFPDLNLWPAAPVGTALLVAALGRDSARWNALVGWLFGVAMLVPLLWWVDDAVGVVPWVGLTAFEAGYVALVGVGWTWLCRWCPFVARRGWREAMGFAVLWVAAEELRSAWPFGGFPWGRLAFSQAGSPLLGLAWLGGAPLVSGVVAALGVLLRRTAGLVRARRLRPAAGTAVALAGLVLAGVLVPLDDAAETGTLKVGAVQGDVPGRGLEAFGRQRQVLDNHLVGTRALLGRVEPGELDLVLWPENGTDVDPQTDQRAAALVDDAARQVGAPLLIGTVQYPDSGGRYNTSVLWRPGVGVVAEYTKQHPAPFAEYIPLRPVARLFSSEVDLVTRDMLPGDRPGVIPLDSDRLGRTVGIGTVICFEVGYDSLVRSAVTHGGEVLVVQTNNATFGHSAESTQQLAMTRFRAVEHGRAAVQVSTVGVSAVVAPDGAVQQRTGLFTAAQLVATLPLRTSTTPATWLGAWPARIVDGAALVLVAVALVAGRRRRSTVVPTPRSEVPA